MRDRKIIVETTLFFLGALALVWAVRNLSPAVAGQSWWLIPFIWVSAACLPELRIQTTWLSRRGLAGSPGLVLKQVGLLSLIVFPVFGMGYLLIFTGGLVPPKGFYLPDTFFGTLFYQVVYIGLSEELFFRGYLQQRLDVYFGRPFRVFGADVGWGLILSNFFFAAGHWVVSGNPVQMDVFIPGLLFGWLQARTGAVAAPALFHGLCNTVLMTLREWS
ncbi:MAG TPA: CPBP family intramembrane glutamic endopeptidase [Nitrospiria bacterium]